MLTSFVPGQEKGNAEFVTDSGAGVYAPRPRQLAAEVGRLRRDPAALGAMRDASARAGRPGAAVDIARFIAELADPALADPALADRRWPTALRSAWPCRSAWTRRRARARPSAATMRASAGPASCSRP